MTEQGYTVYSQWNRHGKRHRYRHIDYPMGQYVFFDLLVLPRRDSNEGYM